MAHVILSAVGRDRPGLVGDFTALLVARGLSIGDSRMINLRGQFAMIALVAGEVTALTALREEAGKDAQRLGLSLSFTPEATGYEPTPGLPFRLRAYAIDQVGIVHKVSSLLTQHGVNIEELESTIGSAPFSGGALFTVEMRVSVPRGVALRTLRNDLEHGCAELNCDIDLEPA